MKRAAAFVLLMVLAACAGPRPSAPPAAAVVPPTQWRAASANAGVLEADWWRGFDDPVLAKIVEKALANNVDIAVSATRVEQARALFQSSRAQQRPNLTGAAGGVRERNVNPGFGIPEEQTAWEAELSVSYDLDLFGRLAHASDAARASLLASQAAHDNVRLAVASSAASGYIALRSLDARLVILRDTLAARADSLNLAKRRADTGYAPTLDLHQAEAEYRATAQLIPATELAISRQENGLSVLLGESPRSIERGVQLVSLGLPQVPPGLPSDLLRRRPDIAQAERQVVAADRSLDSARDAFMPSVQLTASGGYVGSTLLEKTPLGIFSVGGSILAPLLDGGRLRAQAGAAAARRDEAAFAYRKTVLVAFREVEDSLVAVDLAAEQERSVYAQREALALALAVATKRYRAGYSPYLEQLDAQRSLLSAELALVNIRADRLNATVSLYQAMGGGWTAKGREPGADRLAGSAR